MSFDPHPVELEGTRVRLVPLDVGHAADLFEAGADPEIWRYMLRPQFRDADDTRDWVIDCRRAAETGCEIPFAIIHRTTGRTIGSISFLDIRRPHRALEIGRTWVATLHQRTAVNTECKYLLLRHAFEALGAIRVQFKTDSRNVKAQGALERIGAIREGVLRKQMIVWDGFKRDSVYYSIVEEEWPRVRGRLEELLGYEH